MEHLFSVCTISPKPKVVMQIVPILLFIFQEKIMLIAFAEIR